MRVIPARRYLRTALLDIPSYDAIARILIPWRNKIHIPMIPPCISIAPPSNSVGPS